MEWAVRPVRILTLVHCQFEYSSALPLLCRVVSSNRFSGTLPDLSSNTRLGRLLLGPLQLPQLLQDWFGMVGRLRLSGSVSGLHLLTNLERLEIHANSALVGDVAQLSSLKRLQNAMLQVVDN